MAQALDAEFDDEGDEHGEEEDDDDDEGEENVDLDDVMADEQSGDEGYGTRVFNVLYLSHVLLQGSNGLPNSFSQVCVF